ncbi:MAG: exodeoxyribonuclease VII large subunit [Rubrivivax sp. SCN 71-131]|jgi:exodeoxyribonuclease VII large subunit|nr:MAG: exodeoxyribonuclease VII large subunit [Rubrivivax sp. SCN 71-131]
MLDPLEREGARQVWGVAALLLAAGDALAARLGAVAVRGEISGFSRAASGHCYLSLKDAGGAPALLRCAMFRRAAALLDFVPADGMQVELRGRIGVYEPRGELQLVVEGMRRLGAGALYEEFLRLRARLQVEGLFDAARKRALPPYPRRIAVVTSPQAAAWHDVMTALCRRAPQVEVVLVASPVQGEQAPPALADALRRAGQLSGVEAVLLVRGGGALEDLWAFNDERVVRAVVACARPVICGVGHESDVTLADLAADLRAPTPTAAAELAAPEQAQLAATLQQRAQALQRALRRQLERQAQRLDAAALRLGPVAAAVAAQHERQRALASRLQAALAVQARGHGQALAQRAQRLHRGAQSSLTLASARLAAQADRLRALDPHAVLRRGFVWVEDEAGRPVLSVRDVAPQDRVRAVWADGAARARIEALEHAPPAHGDDGKGIPERSTRAGGAT